MLNKILSYGVVAGLIAGIPLCVFALALSDHTPMGYGMVIGYVTMLIALSAVFVAIKRYRDVELGGVVRFWPAFALGLGISIVAGIVYSLSWEASLALTHTDFASTYANTLIEQQKAAGVTGEALAKFTAEMEQFKRDYANPLYRLPMTFTEIFPVGVLVSLISAALLRNSRFLPARRAPAIA